MYCDVERFKENEEMEKYGMGFIYLKDSKGRDFIKLDDDYKKDVIKYYDNHHTNLNKLVKDILDKKESCLLIDLHSFSDKYVYDLFNKTNCPDICLGINDDYDSKILELTKNHFINNGYSLAINYPYVGSIIPSNYLNKDNTGIISLMIEVNKRVYLNDDYKSLNVIKANKLKSCLNDLYKKYENYTLEEKKYE